MKLIPITEYIRPFGEKNEQEIELPDEFWDKYQVIQNAGCRLTAELLEPNNVISLCVEHELGDFICEVVKNDGRLEETIKGMLTEFKSEDFEKWKKVMNGDEEYDEEI